jgi:hypothetical protein
MATNPRWRNFFFLLQRLFKSWFLKNVFFILFMYLNFNFFNPLINNTTDDRTASQKKGI